MASNTIAPPTLFNFKAQFRRRASAVLMSNLIQELSSARQKHDVRTGPKQYVFHLCSGQGSDPYCFFPVNPFVDETDLSFEKKKIFMPVKHHFGKSRNS